jgi:hypothetical protein
LLDQPIRDYAREAQPSRRDRLQPAFHLPRLEAWRRELATCAEDKTSRSEKILADPAAEREQQPEPETTKEKRQ